MQHVLVTGCAGYIGSVLVRRLLDDGWSVTGLDNLSFGGESLLGVFANERFRFVRGDIRSASSVEEALRDVDSIVHLAAIVGDPACKAQPELAREVNLEAALQLFRRAEHTSSIRRFVFASTCSNYGRAKAGEFVNEMSELAPVSLYAETKVAVEKSMFESSNSHMTSTVLRFSTVYGVSPRMRFDLTVNDFVREVMSGRELRVFGEQFWRPYCHVEDLARACVHVLRAEERLVRGEVFGVGNTDENYQKRMIAEEILAQVPDAQINYVHRDEDPRDYRVDFSKIRDVLSFEITKRLPDGIREVRQLLSNEVLSDPDSDRYSNV